MKKLLTLILSLVALGATASEPQIVKLYPNGTPDNNGITATEKINSVGDITGVTDPTISIYKPVNYKSTGRAIVICPGGGYSFISSFNEGTRVAGWMADHGITAVVLKYRLPNGHSNIPLEDALNAIAYVRKNATALEVNPKKIGIIGFSAGGHLAASASTLYTSPENRPDYSVLIYPVITMRTLTHGGTRKQLLGSEPTEEQMAAYSCEEHVNAQTPPTFLAHCADDRSVNVANSLDYARKLSENGVPFTLHVYPVGGHGWGFTAGRLADYRQQFYGELENWLNKLQ